MGVLQLAESGAFAVWRPWRLGWGWRRGMDSHLPRGSCGAPGAQQGLPTWRPLSTGASTAAAVRRTAASTNQRNEQMRLQGKRMEELVAISASCNPLPNWNGTKG